MCLARRSQSRWNIPDSSPVVQLKGGLLGTVEVHILQARGGKNSSSYHQGLVGKSGEWGVNRFMPRLSCARRSQRESGERKEQCVCVHGGRG